MWTKEQLSNKTIVYTSVTVSCIQRRMSAEHCCYQLIVVLAYLQHVYPASLVRSHDDDKYRHVPFQARSEVGVLGAKPRPHLSQMSMWVCV